MMMTVIVTPLGVARRTTPPRLTVARVVVAVVAVGAFMVLVQMGSAFGAALIMVLLVALAVSQVVTLYLTPVFYTYMDELQNWLGGSKAEKNGS